MSDFPCKSLALKNNVFISSAKMAESMEEAENMTKNETSDEDDMKEDSDDSDLEDTTEQDEARVRELEKEVCHHAQLSCAALACSTNFAVFLVKLDSRLDE